MNTYEPRLRPLNVCANFMCGAPATRKIKLVNGTVQNKCEKCYTRRIAATRAAKEKKK